MSELLYEQLKEAIYLFNRGENFASYRLFGNKRVTVDGRAAYRFTVWAPNAQAVYLVGDFNQWQPEPLTLLQDTGVWAIISTTAQENDCYKYVVEDRNGHWEYKIDPYAQKFEIPPKDASVVFDLPERKWGDGLWQHHKKRKSYLERPVNIYEVHVSSWKRHYDGSYYTFDELAAHLIPYVKELGYTHIELMPLMEHPLEESWGYQITGYYAVAARIGDLEGLCRFVDLAHQANIGVIMDWVPGHFCRNQYALPYYDGTPTYEYADYNRANNRGWGTLNFDLGKTQVHSFLISNAAFWLEVCHLDGLRVDAVSNMLYLDFDNPDWVPNAYGGNSNLEGVAFLQKLNTVVFERNPHTLMIAEESTAWEGVTRPVHHGGLGFLFKWNMGWMNDTLRYIETDPIFRRYHHNMLTFSFMYVFNEHYILPLSHDEVVHGKNSLLGKTPGDRYNQFATLRALQAYMMAHPGKKLNFMGYELGQFLEWRYYSQLEWQDLQREFNSEYHHFIKTVNHVYLQHKALHEIDDSYQGLIVLDGDNAEESIISFMRRGKQARDFLVVVANFVPVQRERYRVGVPYAGKYGMLLNTEWAEFGGTWVEQTAEYVAESIPAQGQPYSFECVVPSLGVVYLQPKRIYGVNQKKSKV